MKKLRVKYRPGLLFSGALICAWVSSLSHAAADGTRGGGQTVNQNGRPVLRDLIDNTDCRYEGATEFAKDLPEFQGILSAIDSVHWYLRLNIEREMKKLTICKTYAPLAKVPVEDEDGVAVVTLPDGGQVGVWSGDQIFFDMNLFRQLTKVGQAYTLLHEIMHTFIPMKVSMRNTRLRSFVKAVRDHQQQPMSFDQFAKQMQENYITVPAYTALVTEPEKKRLFMKLLDPGTIAFDRMIAAGQLREDESQMVDDDSEFVEQNVNDGNAALLELVKFNDLEGARSLLDASYASDRFYSYNDLFFRDPHFDLMQANMPIFSIKSGDKMLWIHLFDQADFPLLLFPLLYGNTAMVKMLLEHANPATLSSWINRGYKSEYFLKMGDKNGGGTGLKSFTLVAIANFLNYPEIVELIESFGGRQDQDRPSAPFLRLCPNGLDQDSFLLLQPLPNCPK